jgi:hypothetical protein
LYAGITTVSRNGEINGCAVRSGSTSMGVHHEDAVAA